MFKFCGVPKLDKFRVTATKIRLELLQLFDLHGSGKNSEGQLGWTYSSVVKFENFI